MFVATVRTPVEATAVAHTADQAARLACELGMESLQRVHGDLGYDDPMLAGKYFESTCSRSRSAAPRKSRAAPGCWRRNSTTRVMPYYLTPVAELPYPHTMGERPLQDGTRSTCPLALEAVLRTRGQHPGQDGYRELFTNDAISARRQACDVHAGNWTVVLPAVTTFLEPSPANADTATIAHAAHDHPPFADLAAADPRLTLALLSYSDSLRVYTNGHGQRETIGQHRIWRARTAGVCALPVWFDATTVRPPRDAVLLQRG